MVMLDRCAHCNIVYCKHSGDDEPYDHISGNNTEKRKKYINEGINRSIKSAHA